MALFARKDLIDQPAHILVGAIFAFVAHAHPGAGTLLGLMAGFYREISSESHRFSFRDAKKVLTTWENVKDILFHGVGGELCAALVP